MSDMLGTHRWPTDPESCLYWPPRLPILGGEAERQALGGNKDGNGAASETADHLVDLVIGSPRRVMEEADLASTGCLSQSYRVFGAGVPEVGQPG